MATVTLAGRALEVRPATMGFIKREYLPAIEAIGEGKADVAPLLLLYVGHNEGVTAEWLADSLMPEAVPGRDDLPPDALTFLKTCMRAAGQRVPESLVGEAVSPQAQLGDTSETPTGTSAPPSA